MDAKSTLFFPNALLLQQDELIDYTRTLLQWYFFFAGSAKDWPANFIKIEGKKSFKYNDMKDVAPVSSNDT